MSDELSGRELDRAIAEALGWILIAEDFTHWAESGEEEEIPHFHSSLDALKAATPKDVFLTLRLFPNGRAVAILDNKILGDDWHREKESGDGIEEAWALALNKWLTREGEG